MGNWGNVLRSVGMASGTNYWSEGMKDGVLTRLIAAIPKPKTDGQGEEEERKLPETLVRIPIQQAERAQREQEAEREAAAGAQGG